jgi:uncharacterized protein (TIGR03083 family)
LSVSSKADRIIAALRIGYDELAGREFSDDDLARTSGASEWDVSQVLSHLGSGAEIMTATIREAFDGKPALGSDFNHSVWDRWNAMSRRQRAEEFVEKNETLVALFESLDADRRSTLRIDLGYLPAPVDVATVGRTRLNELTLHSWDVRVAFDESATLNPVATAELIEGSGGMLTWIAKPAVLEGKESDILVKTTDPVAEFTLHLADPASLEFTTVESPDGTLTLPGEAWLRLVSGRLTPDHTPESVETTGDITLETLRQVFPGY